jgi:pyruvate formate lyase activating enzyme
MGSMSRWIVHGNGVFMETGIVSNIQKYSLQDGPGIRTTVFLKGCPLNCWWCHNPEGRSARPEIVVMESRCLRCGECIKICPESDEDLLAETNLLPPNQCDRCGACVTACPSSARRMIGQEMTIAAVMAEILRDRIFYEESSGGATFSGGEPLMQPKFLAAILSQCRSQGIHTALDTCGFAPPETLLTIASLTDLVLYDLKFVDDALHTKFTGVSNTLILSNLRLLSRQPQNIWLRIPIIPSVNDQPRHLDELGRFVAALDNLQQVNLLPYHKTGMAKFQRLGEEYRLAEIIPPSSESMAAVAARFAAFGVKAKVGG